jgi:hypothetical protein
MSVKKQKKDAINKIEEDLKSKGFNKLDKELISHNPPKIKWGEQFEEMEDAKKIEYLKKLAATMNHAASLIQDERNQLNELLALKEKQVEKSAKLVEKNEEMVSKELAKVNEERQQFNQSVAGLKGDAIKQMLSKVT